MKGQRVLVTGASSGIGLATARMAEKRGASLVVVGRNLEKLENLFLKNSQEISTFVADLSVPGSASEVVKFASETLGGLDSIIHCAGIQSTQPLRDITYDEFEQIYRFNVYPNLELASAFSSRKIAKSNASITFVSSISAGLGHPGEALYSSTKGAVESITRTLAVELAPRGIRVNSVKPGIVSTPMSEKIKEKIGSSRFDQLVKNHPLGIGLPEDVAESILFLSSPAARWITGTVLSVDGGYSISK